MSPAKTALQCFIDDKETLFRAFKRCDSPAFTNFAKCWKDMKFSLVLYGRRMREFKEWLPLCYTAVLPDLRQFHLIDRRVFALFLLYGIYFKQPLKELIPVRVSLTVMQDMDELKHYAIREQLLDVLFVWHKLLSSGGIQIVHSATFYGPLFAKSAKESSTVVDKRMDELRSDLDSQMAELIGLQSQYDSMKRSLGLTIPSIQDLVHDDEVLSDFRNRLHSDNLNTQLAIAGTSPVKSTETPETTESIGEKRRRLKYRSMPSL